MAEEMKILDICIDSCGILICIISGFCVIICRKVVRKDFKIFLTIFCVAALMISSNMLGLIFRGSMSNFARAGIPIFNFCEYAFSYTLSMLVSIYIIDTIDSTGRRREYLGTILVLYAIAIALLIVSQFTDFYYIIDKSNYYQRTANYWVSGVMGSTFLIFDMIFILSFRKTLTKKQKTAFYLFVLLPVAAIIAQMFIYGIYLLQIATIIGVTILIASILSTYADNYVNGEKELVNSQVAIMMSQIKPHFLYNSLTSIAQLCDDNPPLAKQATIVFADYLRHNMSSLDGNQTVPFSEELEHIKAYLYLEELRFSDFLKIEYDIKATDFSVPTLSVQPIVENAVKWGASTNKNGGIVKISTVETPVSYKIIICDNGKGFNPEKIDKNSSRKHIGIENVKDRLEMLCCGNLVFRSTPEGTTAVIIIPKGEKHENTRDRRRKARLGNAEKRDTESLPSE